MENKVVSDTGPILHLNEINSINLLKIFPEVFIPEEVNKELQKYKLKLEGSVKVLNLKLESKDNSKILLDQYGLDLGESCAIALAIQEGIKCFLTDDFDARIVGKRYGLEVHGTIGIILRAFRNKLLNKSQAKEKIISLRKSSSLFLTSDIISYVLKEIDQFH